MNAVQMENKRNYFRVSLSPPLCSLMTIVSIHGKTVKTKSVNVCIEDIGAGGLKFTSSLKLPVTREIMLEFDLKILKGEYKALGWIVRHRERKDGIWEYGVQFLADETARSKYIALLNELTIRVRKYNMLWSYSYCPRKNRATCLKDKTG